MNLVSYRLAGSALAAVGLIAVTACGGGTSAAGTGASTGSTSTTGGSKGSSTSGSTSTATSTSSSSGDSIAEACAAQAKATCMLRESCSLSSFLNDHTYGSEALCESLTTPTCVAALGATGTGQTPTHIETCVAAFGTYTCTDYLDDNPPAPCLPPPGTLANGTACGASAQCRSAFCAIGQYEVCGTCATAPVVGATCQVEADCGHDLGCATPTGATSGKCAAFVASAGMCLSGTAPCAAGLACVGDNEKMGTMGLCTAQGSTVGAACDALRNTLANCDPSLGLVCIPKAAGSAIGTCQAITLVATGATCGTIGMAPITGVSDCGAGGNCLKASATAATGMCQAPAANGAACNTDVTIGPGCLAPAKCVPATAGMTAGTCTVPNAAACK